MMVSAASGGWKNYCMVGEHMQIANLFLSIFIKMINFILNFHGYVRIQGAWILDN
jgi:hypothetical protein